MSQNNKNQPKNISWKFFNNLLPELSLARQEFPSVIADSTGASKIDRFPLEQHPLYCCLQSTPVTRTLANLNLTLTQTKINFPLEFLHTLTIILPW